MTKVVIQLLNPGESAADNGRTVHALKLAKRLEHGGAEVVVMFSGKAVSWIPRFVGRTDESHPFVKHYGPAFDAVRPLIRACNMCCIRFDATEAVAGAEIPIDGEGREHVDLAHYVLQGYQVINH